jgi:hypothetical protein
LTARQGGRGLLTAGLVAAALGLAACGGSGGSAAPTTTTTTHAGGTLTLTQADNGRTIGIAVPGQVRVDLPYDKASGDIWQLASGGPGFSQDGPPTFAADPGQAGQGIQTLRFKVAGAGMVPLLLDDAPTGPLTTPPVKQFRVTLHAT